MKANITNVTALINFIIFKFSLILSDMSKTAFPSATAAANINKEIKTPPFILIFN